MACDTSATSAGATFLYDLDGTPPFTDLGDVIDVNMSGITTESKEKTVLASASQFQEFCPGFNNGGEVTFTLLAKKAKVTLLNSLRRVLFYGRLQWGLVGTEVTPSYWGFLCFITSQGESHPAGGDKVTISVTVKISGAPAFTEGS